MIKTTKLHLFCKFVYFPLDPRYQLLYEIKMYSLYIWHFFTPIPPQPGEEKKQIMRVGSGFSKGTDWATVSLCMNLLAALEAPGLQCVGGENVEGLDHPAAGVEASQVLSLGPGWAGFWLFFLYFRDKIRYARAHRVRRKGYLSTLEQVIIPFALNFPQFFRW